MSKLKRTESGVFNYGNGVTLEEFVNCEDVTKYLLPSDSAVSFPKLILTNEQATRILNGLYDNLGFNEGLYRVYNENEFWGIGTVTCGVLKINAYVR